MLSPQLRSIKAALLGLSFIYLLWFVLLRDSTPSGSEKLPPLSSDDGLQVSRVQPDAVKQPVKLKPEALKQSRDPQVGEALQIEDIAAFEGTQVNGRARVDKNGRLLLDRDLRRLFDYFLTVRGLYDDQQLLALLASYLASSLPESALSEALEHLEHYLAYLHAVSELLADATSTDGEELRYLVEARQNLRRSMLGQELAEAFFADEEAYEAHQLEAMRLGRDLTLSDEQRRLMLENNDLALPAHLYQQRQKTFQFARLKQELAAPSGERDSYQIVASQYGEQAAQRFVELERQQERWQQKLELAFEQRQRIFSLAASESSRSRQLRLWQQYLEEHFTPLEQKRVRALLSDRLQLDLNKESEVIP